MWLRSKLDKALITLVAAAAANGNCQTLKGYLYRETTGYYFAELPGGHAPRFKISWRAGGLPIKGVCFYTRNTQCPLVQLDFSRIGKEDGKKVLRDAYIRSKRGR